MTRPWIALFSQTGKEIADLAEMLGRWPDLIVFNKTWEEWKSEVDPRIIDKAEICLGVCKNPKTGTYDSTFSDYKNPVITLHGWLRIIPAEICEKYEIYNGHPALINRYPELKNKDPQIRTFEGNYSEIGSVVHRVTAGVDEGEVINSISCNNYTKSLDQMYDTLRGTSLYSWLLFFKKQLPYYEEFHTFR